MPWNSGNGRLSKNDGFWAAAEARWEMLQIWWISGCNTGNDKICVLCGPPCNLETRLQQKASTQSQNYSKRSSRTTFGYLFIKGYRGLRPLPKENDGLRPPPSFGSTFDEKASNSCPGGTFLIHFNVCFWCVLVCPGPDGFRDPTFPLFWDIFRRDLGTPDI